MSRVSAAVAPISAIRQTDLIAISLIQEEAVQVLPQPLPAKISQMSHPPNGGSCDGRAFSRQLSCSVAASWPKIDLACMGVMFQRGRLNNVCAVRRGCAGLQFLKAFYDRTE